ncbi:MAG: histidine phosphatase family protein [Clostridiales bacterium]|nr:histidine phosphatase family protein [Clostridiales bacterium]
MIFYLVRHGQTDWNNEKRFQGHRDIPMNETGIRQINGLADRIVTEKIIFDKMIVSPLVRARETASIIAEKTGFTEEIIVDTDLIERDCGLLEGEVWSPKLDLNDPGYKMETVPELVARAEKVLNRYRSSEDARIMLVSHGAFLTAMRTVLSDHKIGYSDKAFPVIQGNILCCRKTAGEESIFYNAFD